MIYDLTSELEAAITCAQHPDWVLLYHGRQETAYFHARCVLFDGRLDGVIRWAAQHRTVQLQATDTPPTRNSAGCSRCGEIFSPTRKRHEQATP